MTIKLPESVTVEMTRREARYLLYAINQSIESMRDISNPDASSDVIEELIQIENCLYDVVIGKGRR